MTVLLLILGGAIGAPARYLIDIMIQARHDTVFPWGTLAVNGFGSLVLGMMAAAVNAENAQTWLMTLIGTGFCGALTTYSSFGLETIRLIENGSLLEAMLNVLASIAIGIAAVTAGWGLVSLIS